MKGARLKEQNIKVNSSKSLLDTGLIYRFLKTTSWGKNLTRKQLKNAIQNSWCCGVYINGKQIGFARVISDNTCFAYLLDVFIIEKWRRKGISKLLLNYIFQQHQFKNVKWLLSSTDAQWLYLKYRFRLLKHPEKLMEYNSKSKHPHLEKNKK